MARRQPLRWFLVVRHDGTEEMVEARDHTQAKVKAATWFVWAGAKRWPDVRACRLIKGMNSCVS